MQRYFSDMIFSMFLNSFLTVFLPIKFDVKNLEAF